MSYYLNECETMQCQLVYMIQPFERDNRSEEHTSELQSH